MASRLLLIVVLCVLVPTFSPAQPPEGLLPIGQVPEAWRNRTRALRDVYEARPPLNIQCSERFKMEVIIWGDPHLQVLNPDTGQPDKVRLHGPFMDETWLVLPVKEGRGPWNHPFTNKPLTAEPIPQGNPEKDDQGRNVRFALRSVTVAPHDGQPERDHYYEMLLTQWHEDGCPEFIEFKKVRHTGGPILDDPGHGGAGRG